MRISLKASVFFSVAQINAAYLSIWAMTPRRLVVWWSTPCHWLDRTMLRTYRFTHHEFS
jgi:hypothetical protein